jgi:tRNA-modifying protein YgfZ
MAELDLRMGRQQLADVRRGATVVLTSPALFRVTGAGALTCLQGLLTNDLVKPGDGSAVYGALLTPKGMIVVDAWVLRQGEEFTLIVPPAGREAAAELLRRSLPPRLARVGDLSEEAAAAWLVGEHAFQTLAQSGIGLPDGAGRLVPLSGGAGAVALGPETAPFVALVAGAAEAVRAAVGRLEAAGARLGDETDLHAARILAGWPALGIEIDERTLPQEVRYDDIGGVSYTKGCYTGQETVARVHFRGHTNRELRGVYWEDTGALESRSVVAEGREVGTVRSTIMLEDRALGLALLRREVAPGDRVMAGGRRALVVGLPFSGPELGG